MTTKKRTLAELVSTGLSLVVCDSTPKMQAAEMKLSEAKISCASTRWLTTGQVIECGQEWLTGDHSDVGLVLLTKAPLLAHGWRLPLDRIIWMGEKPDTGTNQYAAYVQYGSRGTLDTPMIDYRGAVK